MKARELFLAAKAARLTRDMAIYVLSLPEEGAVTSSFLQEECAESDRQTVNVKMRRLEHDRRYVRSRKVGRDLHWSLTAGGRRVRAQLEGA